MKKIVLFICILSTFTFLTACGNNTQPPAQGTASTAAAGTFVPPANVEYLKEYSYLPAFPGIEFYSGGSTADEQGYKNTMYTVKDTQSNEILKNYEKLLNVNGWKTTVNNPSSFVVEKEGHRSIIATIQMEKDTLVTVVSK